MDRLRIETDRLLLTGPDPDYASRMAIYWTRNQEFFDPWMPEFHPDFYKQDWQQAKLVRELISVKEKRSLTFVLFERETAGGFQAEIDLPSGSIVGVINFSHIVWGAFHSCYLGYHLAEQENGKGYMTEALSAAVRYAFEQINLHRIEANIMFRNIRSKKVAQRLGFHYEGIAPSYLRIRGVWEDHEHWVLLNKNWIAPKFD